MCTASHQTPCQTPNVSRFAWHAVAVLCPDRTEVLHYLLRCWERESRVCVGFAVLPPGPSGTPPSVGAEDVVRLFGGYRLACVAIEVDARRLARLCRRSRDRERRRSRYWLSAARRLGKPAPDVIPRASEGES